MKAVPTHETELGFTLHPAGDYVFQINQDGVDYVLAEDSERKSYTFQCTSIECLSGDPEAVGQGFMYWCSVVNKDGKLSARNEESIATILTNANLMERFSKRFGDDIDLTNQEVADAIKLKLPGETFVARLVHTKSGDNTYCNVRNVWTREWYATKISKTKSTNPAPAQPKQSQTVVADNQEQAKPDPKTDDDW
jgi:hypothetical protein